MSLANPPLNSFGQIPRSRSIQLENNPIFNFLISHLLLIMFVPIYLFLILFILVVIWCVCVCIVCVCVCVCVCVLVESANICLLVVPKEPQERCRDLSKHTSGKKVCEWLLQRAVLALQQNCVEVNKYSHMHNPHPFPVPPTWIVYLWYLWSYIGPSSLAEVHVLWLNTKEHSYWIM